MQIESSDADLDPSSVKVEVAGPTGGKLAVTPGSCATMPAGYCSEAEIDLGNPVLEMKAFRGTAKVTVTASDTVKNLGTGSADVAVTRFKWKVDPETGKSIKAAPAIGENGNVYVVTTNGKVSVLRPDGSPNWWFQTGSAENASIAVSDVDSVETAFVSGVAVGAGAVWAATSSASGTNPPAVCSSGTQPLGAIAITEFMFDGDAQALVGAVAGFRQSTGSKLAVARPSAPTTGTPCQTLPLDTAIGPESGFAVQSNGKVFFGDELGNLRLVELIAGGPTPKWSKATGILIPANPVITDIGVALGGSSVVSGGLFRIALDGTGEAPAAAGTPLWNLLDVKTATGNSVAAGSGDGHLFVEDEAFAAVTAPAALAPKMTLSGAIKAAPAFGSDKALYIASADQKLFVRDLQGNALWDAELGSSSYSSPALDCARDSNGQAISAPGVVYVGADDGFLYAFITDSHGLDVDSPWPKFHRDPKNRANTGFDLTTFRCP
ncbi:MAG TPA: PQQ-binding-like beta-propeller repeat protein [Propionicimonas sp.]